MPHILRSERDYSSRKGLYWIAAILALCVLFYAMYAHAQTGSTPGAYNPVTGTNTTTQTQTSSPGTFPTRTTTGTNTGTSVNTVNTLPPTSLPPGTVVKPSYVSPGTFPSPANGAIVSGTGQINGGSPFGSSGTGTVSGTR